MLRYLLLITTALPVNPPNLHYPRLSNLPVIKENVRASRNALDLIKKYESCRLEAYEDVGGKYTIGWGSTGPGIGPHTIISQGVADGMLISDVSEISVQVSNLVNYYVNQNEYDALISLAYNIGVEAFKESTLLKKIKAHDKEGAAAEFLKWDHVDGKVVAGLTSRRLAEHKLFLTSI